MFITSFSAWSWFNILIRMTVSMIIGAVIGIDRGVKRRGGGARTTITVCLGATMIMIMGQYIEVLNPDSIDISRMASQVISGIGFLGAGSILVSGHQIKGLTSAASIWTCACIGLAIGIGFIDGAVILTAFWLISVHLVPYLENRIYKYSRYLTLYIEVEDGKAITHISEKLKNDNCDIDIFDVEKPKAKGQHFQVTTTFQIPRKINKNEYMQTLEEIKGVVSANEI